MRQLKAKRDKSEPEIKAVLKAMGATFFEISKKDVPDLCCGYRGVTFLVECKSEKGKLREGQQKFREEWQGMPILVARCAEDIINFINTLDK